MSTLKGTDDCTDIILDFIAGGVPGNPDGESRGNYNAVIGEPDSTDDLSQYTIDYIRTTLMDQLLARHPRLNSTATGRYQVIRRTLQAIQHSLGLDDHTTFFTHEVQDKIALQLLIGRGYQSWWRGHMTDAEFAHGLSCEWASLPDPKRDGASHYDGVGMNHAGTTLAHVYAMLAAARAAKPA